LHAKEITYRFAPLPTKNIEQNINEFLPIHSYVKEHLWINIKYIKYSNYQDILDGFKNNSIDIAYLGPLPFIELYKQYKHIQPILMIKQKNSKAKYRCVLAKYKEDDIDFSKKIKVALTQPLSTCGYFMSSILLKKRYNIDLKDQYYNYEMSHTKALMAVLEERYDIAGAKEDIAKKFDSLGMEIIAYSDYLPGFSIVVNTKTIPKEQIQKIQQFFLSLSDEELKKIGGIVSRGIVKADIKDYEKLDVNIKIPKKGNIDEN
jgi:phosphonate transport system substrate-binding protein